MRDSAFAIAVLVGLILLSAKYCGEKPRSSEDVKYNSTFTDGDIYKPPAMPNEIPEINTLSKIPDIDANPKISEVKLKFINWTKSNTWVIDRTNYDYHYKTADKDEEYIKADLNIISESKNPKLPDIAIFEYKDSMARKIATMSWAFYRWTDYGSYLGNYTDNMNDFAKSSSVAFTIAAPIKKNQAKGTILIVAAYISTCVNRTANEYGRPIVVYASDLCAPEKITDDNQNLWRVLKVYKY